MQEIPQIVDRLRTAYLQLGPSGRILLPGVALLGICCLCLLPLSLFWSRGSRGVPTSPVVLPTDGTQPSPTPLFSFDFPTFTPPPTSTSFVPTPFPTLTPSVTPEPTSTPIPSPTVPSPTATLVPTDTVTASPTSVNAVVIIHVDKVEEYVEIQNLTGEEVNLRNWRLVSERGGETCRLRGRLDPGDVLRIWARRGNPGFDCRLGREIWRDNADDPAVLYNPEGEEVSRFP